MTDTTQATGDNTQAAGGTQSTDTTATSLTAEPSTTDAGKTDATATTTEPGKTDTPAEIVYDFKAPDGVVLDEAMSTDFKALAKELGLTAEGAQKVVDLQVKAQQAAVTAHATTVQEWKDSITNDKDFGGDKLAENMAIARKGLALAPPETRELLKAGGLEYHPGLIKWAYAVGKALSEDKHVQGGTAVSEQKSAAQVLYPSQS